MTALIRTMLVLSLPFLLTWGFVSTLMCGGVNALRYAWLEVRMGLAEFKTLWKWSCDRKENGE